MDETFTSLKPTEVTKPIAVKKEYVQGKKYLLLILSYFIEWFILKSFRREWPKQSEGSCRNDYPGCK